MGDKILPKQGKQDKIALMFQYLDDDFLKMAEGFTAIVVFALLSFFLLNYLSQDPELEQIVSSIFSSVTR